MTAENFDKHKEALTVKRSEKPKTLHEETVMYWKEIESYKYHFNRGQCAVCAHDGVLMVTRYSQGKLHIR